MSSARNFKVTLAGGEEQGAKSHQEDSYLHWASPSEKVFVAAVFDGHGGYNGLIASNTCRDETIAYLDDHAKALESWSVDKWEVVLKELFSTLHTLIRDRFIKAEPHQREVDKKGIVRDRNGDPIHGGTTGTVAVLIANNDGSFTVVSANVGDSAGLLVDSKGEYVFVTVDHGPENPDEYKRVQSLDSKEHPTKLLFVYDKTLVCRKYDCPKVFLETGERDPIFVQKPWAMGLHPTNVRYEPAVYAVTPKSVKKDTTCIAMTRALGDFYAHQFGLTYEPSIVVNHVPAGEEFTVFVASDGIWDCWKYEVLAKYVREKFDSTTDSFVSECLRDTIHKAIANFGRNSYDDASISCIHVKKN